MGVHVVSTTEDFGVSQIQTPRKCKTAFTSRRVVSTTAHAYAGRQSPYQEAYQGDRDGAVYDADEEESLSGECYYPDPDEYDENDDDSGPSCGPTCLATSGCKRCYTSGEGTGSDEPVSEEDKMSPAEDMEARLQERRNRLVVPAAHRINELLRLMSNLAGSEWSKPELERRVSRLPNFTSEIEAARCQSGDAQIRRSLIVAAIFYAYIFLFFPKNHVVGTRKMSLYSAYVSILLRS
jgi:hypothetical protein